MKDRDQPSTFLRYSVPTVFIALTLGSIIWFVIGAIDTGGQLLAGSEIISLNKGIFYMLGVGLGLAVLSFVLVYELWLKLTLSKKLSNICTKAGIAAVIIMFFLPQIVHYSIASYLENKGYEICDSESHQWLHARTIVFVNNKGACSESLKN